MWSSRVVFEEGKDDEEEEEASRRVESTPVVLHFCEVSIERQERERLGHVFWIKCPFTASLEAALRPPSLVRVAHEEAHGGRLHALLFANFFSDTAWCSFCRPFFSLGKRMSSFRFRLGVDFGDSEKAGVVSGGDTEHLIFTSLGRGVSAAFWKVGLASRVSKDGGVVVLSFRANGARC